MLHKLIEDYITHKCNTNYQIKGLLSTTNTSFYSIVLTLLAERLNLLFLSAPKDLNCFSIAH